MSSQAAPNHCGLTHDNLPRQELRFLACTYDDS